MIKELEILRIRSFFPKEEEKEAITFRSGFCSTVRHSQLKCYFVSVGIENQRPCNMLGIFYS